MSRYKLISGTHYERNPLENTLEGGRHHPDRLIKYEAKGAKNIVESERKLDELYPNKFEKLTEREEPREVTEERRDGVDDLLSAPGSTWKEDDRAFLEGLSDKDFARVVRTVHKDEDEPEKGGEKKQAKLGEDVTSKFQRAYDHGFKVYRNPAGKHQVTKAGRGGGKVLNGSPLSEEQVDSFLDDYIKEE